MRIGSISKKDPFDVNDFDISFARGLSLVDGVRTFRFYCKHNW